MPIAIRPEYRAPWLCPLDRRETARAMEGMLASLGVPLLAVDLTLTDDTRMERYNRRHMGCPGPTNILTFPGAPDVMGAPGKADVMGGATSLVLNLDALARECLLYGQDGTDHLLRLLAHGLGHAAGYDHGPAMDEACTRAEARARSVLGLA